MAKISQNVKNVKSVEIVEIVKNLSGVKNFLVKRNFNFDLTSF
jgi:hypothetical protein